MGKIIKPRLVFSKFIEESSLSVKIAYIAVMTAMSVIGNTVLELRVFDVQFSFTIVISALCGIVLGGVGGFVACVFGDFIGWLINSFGQLYMPWVGLSTGMIAFISGVVFNNVINNKISVIIIKTAIVSLATFLICTVAINSTGFYFYNKSVGFSTAVVNYVAEHFGGETSFVAYLAYRLIFKGQIFNSIANYALLFILLPILFEVKPLKRIFL